jgi:hypothetical protein
MKFFKRKKSLKNSKNFQKNKEKTIFILTIIFMAMIGILLNQDINKGLFKENIIESKIIKEPIQKQFAPSQTMKILPVLLAIIIIILTILKKENIIDRKKIQTNIKFSKKQIKLLIKSIIKIHKKIENIQGINIKKIIKFRPDFRKYYYLHIWPITHKEFEKTKELWIGEYKPENTPKFIAMLLVTAVIAMSIFSFTSFNKGLTKEITTPIKIIQTPVMQLSPSETLNIFPFIIALIIISMASYLKIKRDYKK